MLRVLIIFLFFTWSIPAQNLSGSWILSDVTISGIKGNNAEHDEYFKHYRENYLEENGGKIIYEFRSDGVMAFYIVKTADTLMTMEFEWRKEGKTISAKSLNATEHPQILFEQMGISLCQTFTVVAEEVTIAVRTTYTPLPFKTRTKHTREQINAYFKAGVPSLNKTWALIDYSDAALVICDLYENSHVAMPHHGDSSYNILEKLTDLKALALLFASNRKEHSEMYYLYNFSNALLRVGLDYSSAVEKESNIQYSKEQVLLMKAMLFVVDRINTLANSDSITAGIHSSKRKDIFKYQDGMMRGQIMDGFSLIREKFISFRIADICDFGNYFFDFCEKNYRYIPEDLKHDFDRTLEEITTKHSLQCLHRDFKRK